MKFPPINLWSKPNQPHLEAEMAELRIEAEKFKHGDGMRQFYLSALALERLQELEFVYYCRTGRFPENSIGENDMKKEDNKYYKCNECDSTFDEPVIVADGWCDEEDICYVCPFCDSDSWKRVSEHQSDSEDKE